MSGLVLRCWEPRDAPLLQAAINESLEHLRPWMPWARQEPEDLDAKVRRLRQFRARFDVGRDLAFAIFDPEERTVLGAIGLHARIGAAAREIGYWVHVNQVRRGIATAAAAALAKASFELLKIRRLEIQCDPANLASAGVPRRLGFDHTLTIRRRAAGPESTPRDTMIWVLERKNFASSAVAGCSIEAVDGAGFPMM